MTNLYIINEVLSDYTSGMVVIAAASLERCREIFSGEFSSSVDEYDEAIKSGDFKVVYDVNYDEGVVSYVYGGG
jgi:hypothetical protein